jgi:hypothetical protein
MAQIGRPRWDDRPKTQIANITVEEYEKARSKLMGSHMLETFAKSPRMAQNKMLSLLGQEPKKQAYEFGKAFHCFVLEGLTIFHDRYEIANGPINEKTGNPYGKDTKAYSDWLATVESTGKDIISDEDYHVIQTMAESLSEMSGIELLNEGLPEVCVRGTLHGVESQSRLDWWNQENSLLVDLKTTEDLDWFQSDFRKYKYDNQLAYYRGMAGGLAGLVHPVQVWVIAVEKRSPYRCQAFRVSEEVLAAADEIVKFRLESYKHLVASAGWERPWPGSLEYGRTLMEI